MPTSGATLRQKQRSGAELRKSEASSRSHKHASIRNVLALTRKRDTVSVADLSHTTRLSKTTVKKTLDHLASMKLLVSAGKGASTEEGGKRPELYRFNKGYGYVICVHVTPDAVIAVTTDLHGDITYYRKTSVGSARELGSILSRIADDVRSFHALKASTGEKLIAIAVALPGLADSARGISIYSPHYPAWGRNVPSPSCCADQLGPGFDVPVFLENVNRWQALAERDKGVAGGVTNFLIIDMLDEGLGSAIVTHGELMRGAQALSGEIGHMNLNPVDGAPLHLRKPRLLRGHGLDEAHPPAGAARRGSAASRHRSTSVPPTASTASTTSASWPAAATPLCTALLDDVAHLVPGGAGQRHHGERPRAGRHPGPGRQGGRAVPRPAPRGAPEHRAPGRREEGPDRVLAAGGGARRPGRRCPRPGGVLRQAAQVLASLRRPGGEAPPGPARRRRSG